MAISLSDTIREHLKQPGQSRVALVKAMGYRNLNKGLRLLDGLVQRQRMPEGDQTERLARGLGLDNDRVQALARVDLALVDEEIRLARSQDPRYRLTMRIMAAVYCQEYLPGELPLADALERAAALALERHRCCCLNTPSSRSYWFSSEGALESVSDGGEPYMQVGGFRFLFGCGQPGS